MIDAALYIALYMPTIESMKVCVIGAGIIGVSTAYNIQQVVQNVDVTIIADMFMPNRDMASYGPAGIWIPRLYGNMPVQQLRKWSMLTYNHLKKLCNSDDAQDIGIQSVPGCWSQEADRFCHMAREEVEYYGYKYGWNFTTYVTDTNKYIPWLLSKFLKNGGKIREMKVSSLQSLYDDYTIIVNCCGLRSQQLVDDKTMYPIRGQVYKVFAPWIKTFILDDVDGTCIIPGTDGIVTVGGTHQVDRWDTGIDQEDSKEIWNKCIQLEPSLKQAKVIEEWAGLRPVRSLVRLEVEKVGRTLHDVLVVHNYGHGGSGVTFHWGCAQDVAHIIKDHLSLQNASKL